MDTYFCYIHRASKTVAELRILDCETQAGFDEQVARLQADYPDARLEIFRGDALVADGASPQRIGEDRAEGPAA